jgi:hypothetical protein
MGTAVIGLVFTLIGVGIGYVTWGRPAGTLQDELARVRTQAREIAARESAAASRLQAVEAQVTQAAAELAAEKERREKLDALAAKIKR